MFATAMGEAPEFGKRPVAAGFGSDGVPEFWQAIIDMPGLGETQNIQLDQFDPVMKRGGFCFTQLFVVQSEDGVTQGFGMESGQDRSTRSAEGTIASARVVTDPCEGPTVALDTMEGVENVCRSEAGDALATGFPFSIEQDRALA
jgi:hypothetical protein